MQVKKESLMKQEATDEELHSSFNVKTAYLMENTFQSHRKELFPDDKTSKRVKKISLNSLDMRARLKFFGDRTKIEQDLGKKDINDCIQVQNVVATASLGLRNFCLKDIAIRAKNAEYNPKRFNALILRVREPIRSTALIFQTGKIVCTGCKSEEEAKNAVRLYAKIVKRCGFKVKLADFKIPNMVGTTKLSFPLNLEALANKHLKYCRYEPELFPGLVYRMNQSRCIVLCFSSGKLILTGAKSKDDLIRTLRLMLPTLRHF